MAILAFAFVSTAPAQQAASSKLPTPPDIWKDYNPDAGDFKEEIISEGTMDGIYSKDSWISAYVNGEEVRVFCKYAVKADAKNAHGLLVMHGWTSAHGIDREFLNDGWAVLAHDWTGMEVGLHQRSGGLLAKGDENRVAFDLPRLANAHTGAAKSFVGFKRHWTSARAATARATGA